MDKCFFVVFTWKYHKAMLTTYRKYIYLRKFIIINNAHNISTVAHYALPHNPNQISALDFAANEASYLTIGSDRRVGEM